MEAALDKSGQEIRPRDTVLLYMATNDRLLGKPGYLHDFPGLALESVHWLADRDILMFGVEAISPAPEGEPNYLAHMACAERGITHMECLANLDKLVGRGRFRFIGFPLKIRGGTASPIRAVAVFECVCECARVRALSRTQCQGGAANTAARYPRGNRIQVSCDTSVMNVSTVSRPAGLA